MAGKSSSSNLPPGFRFHPTDEELIIYYLRSQATSRPCPGSIIPEVDIYKFDPWELPEKSEFRENEWYFFTPRDRKYPNGVRPNRAAVSGYWKATGTDKSIYSGSKYVGVKKALVFYKGKPPKGTKTDWIMHEYRLSDSRRQTRKQNGSMRLDDWVLCRIYKKKSAGIRATYLEQKVEDSLAPMVNANDASGSQVLKITRTCSLSHLWELDCLGSLSQMLSDNPYNSNSIDYFHNSTTADHNAGNGSLGIQKTQFGQLPYQCVDSVKSQANAASSSAAVLNQPNFVNPLVFQFQ